ncbi:MAG TPA: 4'-phosphopantetheinyl transferase superfamily protein [Allosphingosinicella sp.]|nr:4'-phosphopantetheinyl transferase superfamily protein [Allosphingosinicella sp.]
MIDLRLFGTDLDREALGSLHALLDGDERERARSFRFERDRARFIARRGQLRLLLSEHLARAPSEIVYARGRFGKPRVEQAGDLRFNLSHSDGLALCAIARGVEIGCDIERRRSDLASPETAERFFAAEEQRILRDYRGAQWVKGFFDCWTRKEAYVKALGDGLSCPLDSFHVSLEPEGATRLEGAGRAWRVTGFAPAPCYHAAVAIEIREEIGATPPDPRAWIGGKRGELVPPGAFRFD